ncbi:unnamed protein product [Rhizophagus irregularis]|nr:unnamed protein product [Rhizophagus irregularis]
MGRLNEERIRICTLLEESIYSPSDLARKYKVSVSTITRLYEKFQKTKSVKDLPKTGRPHLLTQRTERRAARYIISGECSTAVQVQKKLQVDHKIEVSAETVRRAFKKNDLKSMVKVKKPLLLPHHKKARYEFAKKYKHWSIDDWKKVVWSDESKFNVFGSDGREYCWKKKGKPLKDQHVKGTIKFGGGGVFVWRCFTAQDGSIIITNKTSLWEKIQTSWNNIETEVCTKLIETIPRRIEDVIKQKGGYTKW